MAGLVRWLEQVNRLTGQWLRAGAAFPEDLSWGPSSYTGVANPLPGHQQTLIKNNGKEPLKQQPRVSLLVERGRP